MKTQRKLYEGYWSVNTLIGNRQPIYSRSLAGLEKELKRIAEDNAPDVKGNTANIKIYVAGFDTVLVLSATRWFGCNKSKRWYNNRISIN